MRHYKYIYIYYGGIIKNIYITETFYKNIYTTETFYKNIYITETF